MKLNTIRSMALNQARVYFRSFLPSESHPDAPRPKENDIEDSWREMACMEFVHDSHSKCETLWVDETTDAAILAELQKKHPNRFILVDKVSWLEEALD
jgi:hypothetical protein